jgi:hypothetical protein
VINEYINNTSIVNVNINQIKALCLEYSMHEYRVAPLSDECITNINHLLVQTLHKENSISFYSFY